MNKMKYQKITINIPLKEHAIILDFAKKEMRTLGSLGRKALFDYVSKSKEGVTNGN